MFSSECKKIGNVVSKTCKKTLVPRAAVRFPMNSVEEHMLKNERWCDNIAVPVKQEHTVKF